MPRGRPKKKAVEDFVEPEVFADVPAIPTKVSEKAHLLALYKELKDLGIYSLSNLENRIARAE